MGPWLASAPSAPANDGASRAEDRRAASSGRDRVSALYTRHRTAIRARCRRLLRDDAAAEDATHETFLRVVRHARQAPPDAEALAWLYRIATNYCLNELRHLRIAATTALDEAACEGPTSLEAEISDRDLVRKMLTVVPEKLRVVAVLRHVDGWFDAEIAAALGVGRRTVVYRLLAFREKVERHHLAVANRGVPRRARGAS